MKHMSFALTRAQIEARSKTVTRRLGWRSFALKPGDLVQAVYKSQGLRKGQKVEKLCVIRIVDVRLEPLSKISQEEVIREGFPDMTPADFIAFFGASHKGGDGNVTRIEFEYLEEE